MTTKKPFKRLLLTGAAGGLGKVLRERLRPFARTLRLSDIAALAPAPLAQSLTARAQRNERIIASTTSQAGDEDC